MTGATPLKASAKLNSPANHGERRLDEVSGGSRELGQEASEGAATVEENENYRRARQGDQGQGSEIGDQVEIDAHGQPSQMSFTC